MGITEEDSILEFHAQHIDADIRSKRLGFCDQFDETWDHYLTIGRLDEIPFDFADDLGEIYIERDDQCWGGYGGIKRVVLERNRLAVRLGRRMAQQLSYEEIRVGFELSNELFQDVQTVLSLIMQGFESRVVYQH